MFTTVDQRHIVQKIEQALREIIEWCDRWGQKLNSDKAKAQYFTNRYTFPDAIKIGQEEIAYIRIYRFLGMYIDSPRLRWTEHIRKLAKVYKSCCNNEIIKCS